MAKGKNKQKKEAKKPVTAAPVKGGAKPKGKKGK